MGGWVWEMVYRIGEGVVVGGVDVGDCRGEYGGVVVGVKVGVCVRSC